MKHAKRILSLALAGFLSFTALTGCRAHGTEGGEQNPPSGPVEPVKPVEPVVDPEAPVFFGLADATIVQGTYFDCFAGVSATCGEEDLTDLIRVTGNVNTAKAGEYALTYSVTAANGKTTESVRKVTVTANAALSETRPTPVYETETAYNIARGCSVTATSTSNDSARLATDGAFDTRWESDHGVDDVSFTVDLGAVLSVEKINIYWEAAFATEFKLLYSLNGTDYRDLRKGETPSPVAGKNNVFLNSFDMVEGFSARYLRVKCSSRVTQYGYSIFEFEALGKKGTVVPTEIYPVLYEQKGSVADAQWLLFDLGAKKTFDKMNVEQVDWKTPAEYDILYADENSDAAWEAARASGHKFTLEYGTGKLIVNGSNTPSAVSARFIKFDLRKRSFADFSYIYKTIEIKNGDEVLSASVSASSEQAGFEASNLTATGDKRNTPWKSEFAPHVEVADFSAFPDSNRKEGTLYLEKFDLGDIKQVGRVDLVWRGDDGGKGKYYDLQISADGTQWKTVFRQTHGDRQNQSVYVYESARYLRIVDYQNVSETAFMLESISVYSQYPESSGEGKVRYDTTLQFPDREVLENGNGTYVTGGTDFPTSRLVANLDDSLRGKPVPSNDWWQGLLVRDYGYNMYMNPLTATYSSAGLWLTNPGAGYYSGDLTGNGRQTIDVDAHDIVIGYAGMTDARSDAMVRVTGFSDYGISTVMSDNEKVDKFTAFLSEGSLYAYCYFAETEKAYLSSNNLLAVYDLSGNRILSAQGQSYTGDSVVVCVRTHSGYRDDMDKSGEKEYEERYYVVNAPADTLFIRSENAVNLVMKNGNYLSVGAMSSKTVVSESQHQKSALPYGMFDITEAKLLHDHGYAFIVDTSATYAFDEATNEVKTAFRVKTALQREGFSHEAYTAYLPHQLACSDYDFKNEKTAYCYPSVRGESYSFVGNLFRTKDVFYGIVPTFAEPSDDGYEAAVLYQQLLLLYENNGGDNAPDKSLISGDPYWQGKNLHPMAMAALAADQIGATDLRDAFLDKIEYILTDWFTYDPVGDAEKGSYFYYDTEWGTLYYQNSEFGAGVNLADHYFTYGYYTLAAGVLSSYRPAFAEKFGSMVELLIRDYMNPSRTDNEFPYMRNFDPFAGHGWAGGYADNDGGNNQESAGEALNSWVGAYLYATAVGNEEIRLAAIYGFTTELSAIKHYWFNYYGDFGEFYPFHCAGQVYGASNFFGTFFNGEPLYMYGIHLIPGEEFLTSYALNEGEQKMLSDMIDAMRREQASWNLSEADKKIHAWQHIFIPIVSIYDPDEAIAWCDQTLKEQGNVGNTSEQFNVYWLVHGMKSMGTRTTDIWAENGATATVYKKDGNYRAVCWNPTQETVTVTFRNKNGVTGSALVPAGGLVTVDPNAETTEFKQYKDGATVSVSDFTAGSGAEFKDGKFVFSENGEIGLSVSCGTRESYSKIVLSGELQNAKLFLDGEEVALRKTENGFESSPLVLTFKHELSITADGGTLQAFSFKPLTLIKIEISATAHASTDNGVNVAQSAVDGDMTTRWESQHGSDDEWIVIELSEAVTVYQLQIYWEAASARGYEVLFSATGEDGSWVSVFEGEFTGGRRTDKVTPKAITEVKFIKIRGISRTTDYGYSIYEIELYNFGESD